jgi:hypothetical protein
MLKEQNQNTTEIKEVKIKLDALIRAKIDLEQNLRNDEKLMKRFNSIQKSEKPSIDMVETIRLYDLKLDQLLHFKEAIRNGNNNTLKDSEHTNDYYIYLLSNYNRKKALLLSMNTFEGVRPSFKDPSKKVAYVAQMKLSAVQEEIAKIESEIRKIENILSDFNHSVEVEVLVYTELNLL